MVIHRAIPELKAGLDEIRQSPKNEGALQMIVRRPAVGERETLEEGFLTQEEGLEGDNWLERWMARKRDKPPNPDTQLTLMNARVIALLAGNRERWPLAGDQLYIDLDLSDENLPPGTQLKLGSAVIEITDIPHTGCSDFADRYGEDASLFVNSPQGRELNLRGIYARVIKAGNVKLGDMVIKI